MAWAEITSPYNVLTNRSTENGKVSKAPSPSAIVNTLVLSLFKYTRNGCQIKARHCVIHPKHETKQRMAQQSAGAEGTNYTEHRRINC